MLAVLRNDIGKDAAAHVEFCGQPHEARLDGRDQVVQDAVGDVFVEVPFVTERPDVEFEAFQFDTGLVGDVIEDQGGEIGLAGFWT